MKGATYVTVEADAAFVMPMNASGGQYERGYTIKWETGEDGGLSGVSWTAGPLKIYERFDDNGYIENQIDNFFENISADHEAAIAELLSMGCIDF